VPATTPKNGRSRYIDSLRAVAIARVYVHHAVWFGWLTVVFPSMNVMFALAGCLTAASLDRGGPLRTVRSRVRRLLPPLWVLAAVAVPLMVIHGWRQDPATGLAASDLWLWIVPVANPPASAWGAPFALALWYIRAYLWLVLFSPLLWWAFRRWPVPTLLALPAATVIMSTPWAHYPITKVGDVMWATACYGTSWVLGYARYTGLLDRLSWKAIGAIAVGTAAAGLLWSALQTPLTPLAVSDPLAEMLWGSAFVVVLMRLRPTLDWLDRIPVLSRAVSTLNSRAVTIYVWHLPMLFAATSLLALTGLDLAGGTGLATICALGAVFTAGAVLGTGWIEDLAARRRPALLPGMPPPPQVPSTPDPEPAYRSADPGASRPVTGVIHGVVDGGPPDRSTHRPLGTSAQRPLGTMWRQPSLGDGFVGE
jgi:peptidoglycan/LPS O-acetylase OafA/YrhL